MPYPREQYGDGVSQPAIFADEQTAFDRLEAVGYPPHLCNPERSRLPPSRVDKSRKMLSFH